MPAAPIPRNEPERLAEVRALGPLGPLSGHFDEIARLMASAIGAQSAVITLLEESELVTIGTSDGSRCVFPRDEAACAWTAVADRPIVIPDTTLDDRLKDLPLTTQMGIRSYAGAPIRSPAGIRLGSICVMDPKPGAVGDEHIAPLETGAEIVSRTLLTTPHAEQALRRESLVAGVFESSLTGIVIASAIRDDKGVIVDFRHEHANRAAAELLGLPLDRLMCGRASELLPSLTADGFLEFFVRIVETGEPSRLTTRYADDRIDRHFAISAVKHADGVAISFDDVTEQQAARERLEQSERTTRLALEAGRLVPFEWDIARDVTRFRGPTRELLGVSLSGEVIPTEEFRARVHPDDVAVSVERCNSFIARGTTTYENSYRVFRDDGSVAWLYVYGTILRDEHGDPATMVGLLRDISRQVETERRLRDNQQRLAVALSTGNIGTWDWYRERACAVCSDRWFQMLGYEPNAFEVTDDHWAAMVHPEDHEAHRAAMEAHLDGRTDLYRAELRARNAHGGWQWILDIGRVHERDEHGRPTRLIGCHVDIDELKCSQLELERRNAELELSRDAAEAASRAKDAFLANISHELRSPLAAIVGYAEILGEDRTDLHAEAAEVISRNGAHVLSLVNDMLDLARVEADRLRVERRDCRVRDVIDDILSTFARKAQGKGIEFESSVDPAVPEVITSDPVRIRQIIANLVTNAIKFTEGGSIRITALAAPSDRITIEVADTGIGMDPARVEELFRPFTQGDPTFARFHGGAGLGLTISRRLAHLLGGELVCARTQPDAGTIMRLELPAMLVRAGATPEPHQDTAHPRLACRILIAEDGDDNRRLLVHFLTAAGADVTTARDGHEAIDLISHAENNHPFDVVLMDMQMPGIDGYQATRRLRENGYDRPIIALTAHAMAHDRARCLEVGCDDYAAKPIPHDTLIELCRRWTGSPRRDVA